jgi:hypothetical protein
MSTSAESIREIATKQPSAAEIFHRFDIDRKRVRFPSSQDGNLTRLLFKCVFPPPEASDEAKFARANDFKSNRSDIAPREFAFVTGVSCESMAVPLPHFQGWADTELSRSKL